MSCKNETFESDAVCDAQDYSDMNTLLKSDDIKKQFTDDQIKLISELFNANNRCVCDEVKNWVTGEYSNEVQKWIYEEYSPEVQKWLVDVYAAEIQNWLEDNFFYVLGNAIKAKFKRLFHIH